MKEYIIKKGKHYSNWFRFPFFTFNRSIKFYFNINSSSHYVFNDDNKYDYNKLFGLSNSYHHQISSARIGWRAISEEQYAVCLYCYDDNKRIISNEILLNYDTFYGARIIISKNNYYLLFKDSSLILQRYTQSMFPIRMILKPFFGGDNAAPNEIKIQINVK